MSDNVLIKARELYKNYFGNYPSDALSLEEIAIEIGQQKEMGINKKEAGDKSNAIRHFVNQLDRLPVSITLPECFTDKSQVDLYSNFSFELKELCLKYSRKALKLA